MDQPVRKSLLRNSSSSLHAAINLVAKGTADAAVSAGNSAAIMALATYLLHRQPGIDRPAFGGGLPTRDGTVFVLDIGANPQVSADNLVQFAIMGDVFLRLSKGLDAPRIGLLSNGTESSKGTDAVKEANEALNKLDLNFIGNVEGNQILAGVADVVVCDGFAGNVLLKTAEGVAMEIFDRLRQEIAKDFLARIASAALMPAFRRIKRQVDFQEYGGAPVLGVNGVMINCHGRSKAKAVTNAILVADRMAREQLVERIEDELHHEDLDGRRRRRLARALHLRSNNP
jgi:glycerol-3-phosphate acyltransferase PlsX